MSPSTSEESSAQVQSGSIESNWPSPPGFFLHLFNRKVIDTSLPIQDQQVTLTCKAPGCDKSYKQPYPGNTPALLQHYKANHRHLLVKVATDAINSGQPREETILGTNVLDGLTDLPPEVTHYFSAAKTTSRRKLKPRYVNCTPTYFRKIFTQWLIGLNIPFETCDEYLTKRMLDGARFGLSQVVSRGQCMLELKKMYFRKTRQLKKQLAEHDGRVALTIYEWNASNKNDGRFLGITLHFLDKSFQPKSYTIGLEHMPKKAATAQLLNRAIAKVLRYYHIDGRIVSIGRDNTPMMTEVATIFKNSYLGDGVDEDFDGDIPCFSHVADLAMGALMAYAFPSKTTGEPVDSENTSAEDEIYANLPENISSVSGRVRQFIRAINENDVLGSLFDNAVGSSTHTARMEKLKETWEETLNNESPLSEYEMIDSFLYFKDHIIEVCKEYNNLHPQNQMGALETPEWEYLTLVRDILGIFVRPTKCLQNTDYVMVYAIIPMVHSLLDMLQGMNTASVRGVYPNIALGITAACDTLKKYYPIYGEDCGRMRLLYLATVLHPQFKLIYFHNIDSFPRELITCIKKELEALYQLYKEYYGDSPNGGSFDGVSRHNHQPSPESEEQAMFAFLRKYAVVNKENNEVDTYLSESVEDSTVMDYYRRTKKRYPILYQLAKDILAIPAASAPTEAFSSALGDMTRKQTRVLPATTKMLAVVKDMV